MDELDRELWRERARTWLVLLGVAAFLGGGGFLLWRVVDQADYVEYLGTSVSVDRSQARTGGRPYLLVKLDDGATVRARVARAADLRLNARVVVSCFSHDSERSGSCWLLRYVSE